jgi:hypothetical protein
MSLRNPPVRKKPRAPKPVTKIYTFVLPVPLIEEVDAIAQTERRSRTQQVTILIDRAVRNYQQSTVRGAA